MCQFCDRISQLLNNFQINLILVYLFTGGKEFKNILHTYASKKKINIPVYDTVAAGKNGFVSSTFINGGYYGSRGWYCVKCDASSQNQALCQ